MRRLAVLLVFLGCLPLGGCAGLVHSSFLADHADSEPERVLLTTVPFYAQEKYQCGPAALAMLLSWSGIDVTPAALTPKVYSPDLRGSLQPAIIAAARRHGRLAYQVSGKEALSAELAAGHPVLILQNLGFSWLPRWHYAVVIGYNRADNTVYLHSGRQQAMSLSARVLVNTWSRSNFWGLLVLPPERLPASATENTFLAAVGGLEQAGQWYAATRAYGAALQRWPENFIFWVGLGNNFYLLHDYAGAQKAFRQAIRLQPNSAPVLNNLALALAATGQQAEALTMISQAIELGGPLLAEFILSREQILATRRQDTKQNPEFLLIPPPSSCP